MIFYDDKEKCFHIKTKNTSYVIGILKDKYLLQMYYGKKIKNYVNYIENCPVGNSYSWAGKDIEECGHIKDVNDIPFEYPCYGSPDLREPAFHAQYENGSAITDFEYQGYKIYEGKLKLAGLPCSYTETEDDAETLEIYLKDQVTGLEAVLSYTAFYDFDVITKNVKVKNGGTEKINIKRIMSSTVYLFGDGFELLHLEGNWGKERNIQRRKIINGEMSIDSKYGGSSHGHSPFIAMARSNADENNGEVYAQTLVYSGNHKTQIEATSQNVIRVNSGLNDFGFNWLLESGEDFQTPETILVYTDNGFGGMSRIFHRFIRTRITRGKHRDAVRPILLNNWEATYYDFDENRIVEIAKKAKDAGVELFVLDDGWFGDTPNKKYCFGDWKVDKNKLPYGIEGIAQKVTDMGLGFGLWFEPEAISEDSELFKAHPDWCIEVDGRKRSLVGAGGMRRLLDYSRKDVCDYIVETLSNILKSAPISYIKWDMNISMTEIGSYGLPPERQQELPHRYMLGLYDVLERITTAFPDVLYEGCASGGGRFDAGMMHYFQQYWTSDCTDAIQRLYIQYGTSMFLPASAMSAHVAACPNHQNGRTTPLETRANVAMTGQFGYEFDLNTLSDEDFEETKKHICLYKEIRETVNFGELYRLKSPFDSNNSVVEYVSDKKVVVMRCTILGEILSKRYNIKLKGLEPDAKYMDNESKIVYDGDYLMNVGLNFFNSRDFESQMIVFDKV